MTQERAGPGVFPIGMHAGHLTKEPCGDCDPTRNLCWAGAGTGG